MIKKLILAKQSYLQLSIVMFGSLFGLLLVMASLQFFLDFKQLIVNKEDLISPQFLVVNKRVNILNTLTGGKNTFTESEIKAFEQVPSVEKIGSFKANRFKAKAAFDFMGNSVYTDMFFEAVPDTFLDVKADNWDWKEGQNVPIILPVDYINLYNFGFAPSQGLPQISQGTAKMAPLKIKISGQGKEVELPGNIAGFTHRINSILVPESFLDYANATYGDSEDAGSSRIVVVTNDPSNTALSDYIKERAYETNLELLKSGKLNSILKIILSVLLLIGSVIVLLSVLGFVQYSQLLVSNSRYEIKTLLHLGYHHLDIFKYYLRFYAILSVVIALFAVLMLWIGKFYFNQMMTARGFEIDGAVDAWVWITGTVMLCGFMVINSVNLFRMVRRLAQAV